MELTWLDDVDVLPLLTAVRAADGVPEIPADGTMPPDFRTGRHLVARDGGITVGYAHVDVRGDSFGNQIVELFVHPDHRRRGIGTALVDEVLTVDRPLRLWSHRDHPGAARIAAARNLERVRELYQMRLDNSVELPAQTPPRNGFTLRTFVPGQDEQAMVDVNRRAFDWHPEQGMLSVDDVVAAEKEAWFDAAGFFLAVDENDKVVGFHWTKVHPDGTGEVYVVGIHPDAQGGGLGRALTLAGLHHLRGLGVPEIILYVESDNAPALAVYRRLGFTLAYTNVAYQR
ncbi:mycothiol synthase [Actinophytocola sp. NPDC049390]|uniref:mycothiol synthase n=1 Tax=Actinophytocola sp. NPDC049390 TaxID=3363894 RepID=UPI0037882414